MYLMETPSFEENFIIEWYIINSIFSQLYLRRTLVIGPLRRKFFNRHVARDLHAHHAHHHHLF